MEGIQIVNQYTVPDITIFSWESLWITFAICMIGVAVISVFPVLNGDMRIKDAIKFALAVGLIVGIFFGTLAGFVNQEVVSYTTEYEIIISEDVSFNDVSEKYEFIDRRGDIYIVREKK
jgi:hypothetical protein